MWTAIIAILSISITLLYFLPTTSLIKQPNSKTRKTKSILIPGPVISSYISNLSLDGLTIIPLVHLPKIKTYFNFPLFNYSIHLTFTTTSSETVFKKLSIDSIDARSKDAAREPLNLSISGVNVDFSGTISQTIEVSFRKVVLDELSGVSTRIERWKWKVRLTGRIYAKLNKLALELSTMLVQMKETNQLGLNLLSTSIDIGDIESLKMEGFGSRGLGGSMVTFLIPFVKGTPLLDIPVNLLINFLAKDLIEGKEMDEMLNQIVEVGGNHIDLSSFGGMVDEEREQELTRTRAGILPTLIPIVVESSTSSGSTTPVSTALEISPQAISSTSSKAFRLKSHLIGPSLLTSFKLPDLAPNLYPALGYRAKLQSLNLVTDELKILLSGNELSKISFNRAEVAFEPSIVSDELDLVVQQGGELIITISDFTVTLLSHFKVHANITSSLVSWATGIKKLGEKGSSMTIVTSRSLQLRFRLSPPSDSSSAFKLTSSTISPFTTITPSFKLNTPALALGTELLNLITSSLNEVIAKGASVLVQKFMKDAVRVYLQSLIEGAEEGLRERGVELPSSLRAREV